MQSPVNRLSGLFQVESNPEVLIRCHAGRTNKIVRTTRIKCAEYLLQYVTSMRVEVEPL